VLHEMARRTQEAKGPKVVIEDAHRVRRRRHRRRDGDALSDVVSPTYRGAMVFSPTGHLAFSTSHPPCHDRWASRGDVEISLFCRLCVAARGDNAVEWAHAVGQGHKRPMVMTRALVLVAAPRARGCDQTAAPDVDQNRQLDQDRQKEFTRSLQPIRANA
jgi:hypothetical protein